jgi:hypothetical protein
MKLYHALILFALIPVACDSDGDRTQSVQDQMQFKSLEERLANSELLNKRLHQRLTEMEKRYDRLMDEVTEEVKHVDLSSGKALESFNQQLQQNDTRITEIETTLAPEPETPEPELIVPAPNISTPEAAPENAQKKPTIRPTFFPVDIGTVALEKIETGRETRRIPIESEETFRDKFGQVQTVIEYEEIEHINYGHQVTFSVENTSKKVRMVSAKAGGRASDTLLQPGEKKDITLRAVEGADLLISVGGFNRRVELKY